ncbi:hypothetical protein [Jannaschia formosa]|uniref:hypothetical protein n=1 Tax=Jannaschia formosa TaxID=2259592 RepID=UPI000E1B5B1D|nr:hypothetical protein [Jannaschia formosa]TFL16346.1 hypothetical protein DR046_20485 [Jannaschia formosa]
MPSFLFLLQIALPIDLLLWLVLDCRDGFFSFLVRATGTPVYLIAVTLITPWAMPPWWSPLTYGVILAQSVVFRVRNDSQCAGLSEPSALERVKQIAAQVAFTRQLDVVKSVA